MKKKIIFGGLLLLISLMSYILIASSPDVSDDTHQAVSVSSTFGFTITPPREYKLWEGVSAAMDLSFKDLSLDTDEIQEFISRWVPETSKVLVFTTADVEFSSRELSKILDYSNERVRDPLINDPVVIVYNDRGVDFTEVPIADEMLDRNYLSLNGTNVQYTRSKGFETHHVVSISVPLDQDSSLMMMRQVPVATTDKDIQELFEIFLKLLDSE